MKVHSVAIRSVLAAALCAWLLMPQASIAAESKAKSRRTVPAAEPSEKEAAPKGFPASAMAERRVAGNPHDRAARLEAARAQLAEGAEDRSRVEAAQQHVKAVLQEHPNDVEALLLGGQTSLLKNDAAAASRYYRAAVTVAPGNASAYLGLGDALTRVGDEAGANAAFAAYRQLNGMEPLPDESTTP